MCSCVIESADSEGLYFCSDVSRALRRIHDANKGVNTRLRDVAGFDHRAGHPFAPFKAPKPNFMHEFPLFLCRISPN